MTELECDNKILNDQGCKKIHCRHCFYHDNANKINRQRIFKQGEYNCTIIFYTHSAHSTLSEVDDSVIYNYILNKHKLKKLKEILQ